MKTKRRWLNSALNEAAKSDTKMPWTRGQKRSLIIAQRIVLPTRKAAVGA